MDCYVSDKVPIFLLNSTVDCVFLIKARYEQIIKRMWSLLLYVLHAEFQKLLLLWVRHVAMGDL